MKKMLLINGGILVGDTFHLIPFFDAHKNYEITWITGTYAQQASECILNYYPNIVKLMIVHDGFPLGLTDRTNFKEFVYGKNIFNVHDYDVVIDDIRLSFDVNKQYGYASLPINNNIIKQDKYIVVQQDCSRDFKRVKEIYDVKFPVKTYSICSTNNNPINDTIRFEGNLKSICDLISGCSLFIGLHSGINCLAYYIPNIKGITLHFWDGLLKFSDFRNDGSWLDLNRNECNKENIERNIKLMLDKEIK